MHLRLAGLLLLLLALCASALVWGQTANQEVDITVTHAGSGGLANTVLGMNNANGMSTWFGRPPDGQQVYNSVFTEGTGAGGWEPSRDWSMSRKSWATPGSRTPQLIVVIAPLGPVSDPLEQVFADDRPDPRIAEPVHPTAIIAAAVARHDQRQ
jgi:hypothetical protein